MLNYLYKNMPILLFGIIWITVFYLYALHLYPMLNVSAYTFEVLLTGIAFVLFGYFLYAILSPPIKTEINHNLIVNDRIMIGIILVMSSLIIIGTILKIQELSRLLGGIDIFYKNPFKVRQTINQISNNALQTVSIKYKIAGYMTNAGLPVCLIGGVYFATFSKYRYLSLLTILCATLIALVNFSRYRFLTNITLFSVAYFYTTFFYRRKEKILLLKRFVKLLLGILSFTILVFIVIISARSFFMDNATKIIYKFTYFYLVGGIPSLNVFLIQNHHFLYGASIFRSVVKWLIRLGMWDPLSFIGTNNAFVTVSPGVQMNTYTFAYSMYQDFGLIGIIFISFIWGWFSRGVIQRYLTNFSLINLLLVSIFTHSLFISFFSFNFKGISTMLYWFLVIYIVQLFFGKRMISTNSA